MDVYNLFDMFLTLFFLMLAVVILGSVAMLVDNYLDPDPDAVAYDTMQQESANKGVKL